MNDVSETQSLSAQHSVDVRGLWCPEPAVRAKKALAELTVGERLEVWSTDPLAPVDLEVLCDRLGQRLVSHTESPEGHVVSVIEKTAEI